MKTPYNPNMNKIIKFFRERPILSLVLIFGLWVNSLPLPDANIGTVRQYNPLETTISNQKALAVSGGDGFTNPYSSDRGPTPKGASDRGEDRFQDYHPSPKLPSGGGPSRNSASLEALKNNEVPDKKDWNVNEWSEDNGQCNDFEKYIESEELPVPVNFEYEKDSNGNPSLLIPNMDSTHNTKGRAFNRIEYDQAASHLHHANEFGIQLSQDFDMSKYNALPTKFDKIQYAKQHVSPEIIISYQNAMGLAMKPIFGTEAKTHAVRGFAGKHKVNVGLVIQSIPGTDKYYLSIINDRGIHVSSYSLSETKLRQLIKNDFWVLTKRNFN